MKKAFYIGFLYATTLMVSCQIAGDRKKAVQTGETSAVASMSGKEELSPSGYVSWVKNPESGLFRTKKIDNMIFSVLCQPSDYLICQEERSDIISGDTYKEKLSGYSDLNYFDLKIESEGGQGELLKQNLNDGAEYDTRVKYFSFGIQKDIQMVLGGDTIPCAMAHFERAFDATPYLSIQIAFPKQKETTSDEVIIFHDRIFGKGILKFVFDKNILSHLPKLKIS
ncbi:MAG: hypothetical protein ACHQIM_02585 [Sphingobacteriales bacterium]